ncbi:hypothetical protein CRUP_020026, partial [Coryphaenoides rupestris]
GVLLPRREAMTVLRRQRRFNTGRLEEILTDNLERECIEERCTMEEAREMEFWPSYVDGDQCKPESPCQNGGLCKDGVNTYVCLCRPNFSGKNCEIEIAKQCSVNNGGCAHFCAMQAMRTVCQCAHGYKLEADKKSCTATELFSCGQVSKDLLKSVKADRKLALHTDLNPNGTHLNPNGTLQYEDCNPNAAALPFYDDDDDDFLSNLPPCSNSTAGTPPVAAPEEEKVEEVNELSSNTSGEVDGGISHWAFHPTVATITPQDNEEQRIVGGSEAIPGEIPWQVSLMSIGRTPFCGGSLLSDLWVITAAHCLSQNHLTVTDYIVRVGEHDMTKHDEHERDHAVAEQILHKHYDVLKSRYNHDIALLRLQMPVDLSERRRPVCLGPKDFTESLLQDAQSSLVSGWGRLRYQGLEASRLQKLEVPYVDRTACKGSSRDRITRFMFCAGYYAQVMDSCQGDSGGPHVTQYQGTWFLTGVVSWGEDCAKEGKYGVYTRVSRYYSWISNTTGIR